MTECNHESNDSAVVDPDLVKGREEEESALKSHLPRFSTSPKPCSKACRSMPVTTKQAFLKSLQRSRKMERRCLLGP